MNYLARAVFSEPWAILESWYLALAEQVSVRAGLDVLPVDAANGRQRSAGGPVALIPVSGVLTQHADLMAMLFGGASTEMISGMVRAAAADDAIGSIVLDISSPGGSVYGVAELAEEVWKARARKPVVAVANSLAASAAYWVASQASEIAVTPGGEVGSIGVIAMHMDESRAIDEAGITPTMITAGKYKAEGSPLGPLEDEARRFLQRRVNEYYEMFTSAVARGRGVKPDEVRAGFAEGRVVGAREALRLGMADRIATLDAEVARMLSRPAGGRQRMAAAEYAPSVTLTGTGYIPLINEDGSGSHLALYNGDMANVTYSLTVNESEPDPDAERFAQLDRLAGDEVA